MVNFFRKVGDRVMTFLGIAWIREAREIVENTRRPNVIEEQLRASRKGRQSL